MFASKPQHSPVYERHICFVMSQWSVTIDVIYARPAQHDCHNRRVPIGFDTALVNLGNGGKMSVEGDYLDVCVQGHFS
jgi:hypothetical protein